MIKRSLAAPVAAHLAGLAATAAILAAAGPRRPRKPLWRSAFPAGPVRALTLAKEAGLFKKLGLDVSLKKIPQKDRHLAMASGDIQCAATTVETWVVWNANGVAATQIFQLDKSYGRRRHGGQAFGGEDRRS